MRSSHREMGYVGRLGIVLALSLVARPADAFIFSEHSEITAEAMTRIVGDGGAEGAELQRLVGSSSLCPREGEINDWDCLRLVADLAAIAGDHSCSPVELRQLVQASNQTTDHRRDHWVWSVRHEAWDSDADLNGDTAENRRRLEVIDIEARGQARTSYRLDRTRVEAIPERAFERRRLNLRLQAVDPDYQTRAKDNTGHFQLLRALAPLTLGAYLEQAFLPDVATNATALYALYHSTALSLAARARGNTELLERAFLTELFAIHFLEDSFAAGHIVGHWGPEGLPFKSDSVRIGTHDHYGDAGVEVVRWIDLEGAAPVQTYIAHGDATMTQLDAAYTALAVKRSLRQLLHATTAPTATTNTDADGEAFDSCKETHPARALVTDARLTEVLELEPIPSPRAAPPPRFRAEAGIFFGAAAAIDGGATFHDSAVGHARATVRGGLGLNGISIDPMNSLAFFEVGVTTLGTHMTTTADSTIGLTFRMRAPGLLTAIEGLPIILAAAATRTPTLLDLAAKAGSGGLFDQLWRARHIAGTWDWQVSALRDFTFNEYFPSGPRFRWEVQAPAFTIRSANPSAGVSWAQSNDYWIDLGMSATRATELRDGSLGFYLAFSASARSFP